MVIYTIKAATEEAAKQIALEKYNTTVISTFDYKQFSKVTTEELASKLNLTPNHNEGLLTMSEKAPSVSRVNPYNLENIVTEGASSKKLVYEILDSDGKIYASEGSKKDALKKGKELIKQLNRDLVCKKVYRVDSAHEIAFKLTYTPQKLENTYTLYCY